ncbi:MAG TPA: membrane protein insertase YidC [Acidobacteriaceae bacterium]|nr:membrane protein insertase YidC [Acidobacteriaceae bacterium]
MAEFSNPNQQGGQDGQTLMTTMIVVVAIIIGYQFYREKTAPPPATPASIAAPQTPTQPEPTAAPAAVATPQPTAAAKSTAPAVPTVQAAAEQTTVVENDLYRITFSNRGAQVTSWVLKQFKGLDGQPLDLVPAQASKLFGYPLSLYTNDGSRVPIAAVSRSGGVVTLMSSGNLPSDINGRAVAISGVSDSSYNGSFVVKLTAPNTLTYKQDYGDNGNSSGGTLSTVNGSTGEALNQALFVPSATGSLPAPATLTFKYSNGDLQATKTFAFDAKTYTLHAEVTVTRTGVPVPVLLSWPGGFGDQNETPNQTAYTNAQFDDYRNGSFDHADAKKVNPGEVQIGPFDFAGVADPFFAAVFLPDTPSTATVTTLRNDLDVSKSIKRVGLGSDSPPTKALALPIVGAALGDSSGPIQTRIYVGPKDISVLKGIHAADPKVSLEPVLEFGFWGPVGKYLFLGLQLIHTYIVLNWAGGSWGWAIIILTVFINLLILPFRVKTMHSALKMQRIQPQMDAIKEKYKKYKVTDPKRSEMNSEIMQLQKDNGVNMFGGCIPQLITMPLLFAFFTMLPRVVELRQAHWLWLPNLQAPDPWHLLPIFMVLSQFLVQFYTPSPGVDPQQQKMMAFMMPAFSGYITWNYASGLALYWSVGNLIGIAQQAVMNRTSLGREMREMAAKRARRKATTIQGRK